MKNFRIKMAMIALFLGVGASFATLQPVLKSGKNATTYFAVQTGTNTWAWQTTAPSGLHCLSGKATCAISSNTTPPPNGFPASYTVISGADKASVYR